MSLQERPLLSPEGGTEKNKLTKNVRTSSGKTISIKREKKQKATSKMNEVERRSAIPRSMTYFVHHGKVLNEKRNNRRKQHWNRNYD